MAYFRRNGTGEEIDDLPEEEYDDGFDELEEEEPEPEMTAEERTEMRTERTKLAFGAGNLVVIIGGVFAILLLLTMLFNMISFVINDMGRSFSLFQTNF